MAAYVEMDQVTKTYQMGEVTIKAADGISFQVEKGEFVVVVGTKWSRKNNGAKYSRRHGYCNDRKSICGRNTGG